MKEIPLTKNYIALVDDEDYEPLSQFEWYSHIGRGGIRVYACRNRPSADSPHWKKRGLLHMHREIMQAKPGQFVDHISWALLEQGYVDNRKSNLRLATPSQNQSNARKMRVNRLNSVPVSKYKGVTKSRDKWSAHIFAETRLWYLGTFDTEEEAARTYDNYAKRWKGEFALLNFPDETS
jgi:hypothetical protein